MTGYTFSSLGDRNDNAGGSDAFVVQYSIQQTTTSTTSISTSQMTTGKSLSLCYIHSSSLDEVVTADISESEINAKTEDEPEGISTLMLASLVLIPTLVLVFVLAIIAFMFAKRKNVQGAGQTVVMNMIGSHGNQQDDDEDDIDEEDDASNSQSSASE